VPVPETDFHPDHHDDLHKAMGPAFDKPEASQFVRQAYDDVRAIHPHVDARAALLTARDAWHAVQHGLATHEQAHHALRNYPALFAQERGGPEGPGFSLEKVKRRATAPPNEHIWNIKDPAGGNVGTIDTTWSPDTGNLHIEDFQSEGGPNTLGPTAIRQLRRALLQQYPGAQSLSGLRISGATYAHKNSGSGPGREATQTVRT
jgi:hypothetical protein